MQKLVTVSDRTASRPSALTQDIVTSLLRVAPLAAAVLHAPKRFYKCVRGHDFQRRAGRKDAGSKQQALRERRTTLSSLSHKLQSEAAAWRAAMHQHGYLPADFLPWRWVWPGDAPWKLQSPAARPLGLALGAEGDVVSSAEQGLNGHYPRQLHYLAVSPFRPMSLPLNGSAKLASDGLSLWAASIPPGIVMVFKMILDLLVPSMKLAPRSGEIARMAGFLVGVALAVNLSRDTFEEMHESLWRRFVEKDLHYHGSQTASSSTNTDVFAGEIAMLRLLTQEKKTEQFRWLHEN